MNLSNIKNTLTTIAGILGTISGVIITCQTQGVALPPWLTTVAAVCGAISIGIIGYFSGKNPDGSSKTQNQIDDQLSKK
jgi:hypothetical protein